MAMNAITPEQVWSWIDQGKAEYILAELKLDPNALSTDISLLEELLALDRELASLPLESPSSSFDAAVLARIPGLSFPALPDPAPLLSTAVRYGLIAAFVLALIISYLLTGMNGTGVPTALSSDYLRLVDPFFQPFRQTVPSMPSLSGSRLWIACLVLPAMLFFYLIDRGIQRVWQNR